MTIIHHEAGDASVVGAGAGVGCPLPAPSSFSFKSSMPLDTPLNGHVPVGLGILDGESGGEDSSSVSSRIFFP